MDNQAQQYFGNVLAAPGPLSNSAPSPLSPSQASSVGNLLGRTQNVVRAINQSDNAPTQTSKQPSLFDRLLPTGGSILGGLLAGGADIATGGAAIPFDAAIAGLGGAAGKTAENALTGKNLWQGDLASGLEGAAGQAGGMLAGKAIGAAGGALANVGARGLASASNAADQATQLAENERIGNEFSAINPKVAQVGPAIAKANALGITNPTAQDLKGLGSIYTGSNAETGDGAINFVKNQALDKAGGNVNFGGIMDNLHQNLADPKNELLLGTDNSSPGAGVIPGKGTNVATSIVKSVRNLIPETLNAQGQIAEQTTPEQGQAFLKAVGAKLNGFNNLDPANPNYETQLAEKNVWKSIYGTARQAVYGRPEVDAQVANTTVDSNLELAIDDAIKTNANTPALQDPQVQAAIKADLTNIINTSKTAPDLLQQESPMVNVSKVGNIQSESDANNPQLAKSVKSNASQIKTQGGILGKDPLKTGLDVGGAYEALVKGHPAALLPALAYNVAKSPVAQQGIGNVLGTLGSKAGMLGLGGLGEVVSNSPNDIPGAAGAGNQISLNQGSNVNPVGQSQLGQLYQSLLANYEADPNNASTASTLGALSTMTPMMQKIAEAQQATQGLQSYFNQAGGAQSPLGGTLAKIGSLFTGGPAASYGKQAAQAGQTISSSLGVPAADIATPSITMNQPAAQQTLSNIQSLINSLLLNSQGAPTSAIPAQ